MKKLSFIALSVAILFSSCKVVEFIPASESLTGIDFRPYAEKGFLFTPYKYDGKFFTLSMVSLTVMPKAELIRNQSSSGQTSSSFWIQD